MLVELGLPWDELETHPVVDHGEATRGEVEALAIGASYGLTLA